jgi:hypothetical protein
VAEHTKGPWRLDDPIHATHIDETYHFIDAGDGLSHDASGFGISGFLSLANARLIAAAPELLDALKRLREKYSRCARLHGNDQKTVDISVDFVDAAIAKAEGRASLDPHNQGETEK